MRVGRLVDLLGCIRMLASLWIFEIFLVHAFSRAAMAANVSSLAFDTAGCEEFGQDAPISPYDFVDSLWKIFYFWAEGMEPSQILFNLPIKQMVADFRKSVEDASRVSVRWDNAALFMQPRPGVCVLFVNSTQNGFFTAIVTTYTVYEDGSRSTPDVRVASVRMKMADRVLGIVNCIDGTAFALARVAEMPQTTNECIEAAARLGLKTQGGKSYLTAARSVSAHDEL